MSSSSMTSSGLSRVTVTPTKGVRLTSRSTSSWRMASRIGVRLTSNSAARSCSVSFAPGFSSPLRIAERIRSQTCSADSGWGPRFRNALDFADVMQSLYRRWPATSARLAYSGAVRRHLQHEEVKSARAGGAAACALRRPKDSGFPMPAAAPAGFRALPPGQAGTGPSRAARSAPSRAKGRKLQREGLEVVLRRDQLRPGEPMPARASASSRQRLMHRPLGMPLRSAPAACLARAGRKFAPVSYTARIVK